jgi:hypothetical protein
MQRQNVARSCTATVFSHDLSGPCIVWQNELWPTSVGSSQGTRRSKRPLRIKGI